MGLVVERFVWMELDHNRLRGRRRPFGVVMVAVVAVGAVDVWGRTRQSSGLGGCGRLVRMATGAVRAAFGFKRFVNLVHDQVHGPQQVCQHIVGLDFQVVGL